MDRTLFYSNMTVSLCIRQGSNRNDDSVSVEELDWSEHQLNTSGVTLNADLEPKAHHQRLMTLYFVCMSKSMYVCMYVCVFSYYIYLL